MSWKLHKSTGVHTLETDTEMVIYMLVEKKYPLMKKVLLQMLELKLESEDDNGVTRSDFDKGGRGSIPYRGCDVPQCRMASRVLGNPSLGSNSNTSSNDQAAAIKEIHEGKYADISSTMSTANIDVVVNAIETIGKKFQDEVNKAASTQLRSSPMMSNFSPLVLPSTTISVPRELNSIDVAATFRIPLTNVGD
ncbi:hypothetical protein Tco_0691852, partial [Tanacetum coccineum]